MAKRIPPSPIASVPHGTFRPTTANEQHALTHEDGDAETTGASAPAGERPTPAQPHEARQSVARDAQAAHAHKQSDPVWLGASAEKQGTVDKDGGAAAEGHGYAPDIAHGDESGYGPAETAPGVHPRFGRQSAYGPHDDYAGTGRNTAGAQPPESRPPVSHAVNWPDGTVGAEAAPKPRQSAAAQQSGDAAIRDDIRQRLAVVTDLDISHIEVTVSSGLALLTGDVPERWMQHEVQAIVSKVPGVSGVDNRLHERRTQPMSRPGESQEGHKI